MTAAGGGAQALHINAYRQVVQRADGGAVAVAQVELQVRPVREKGLAVRTCGDGGQTGQAALPRQRLRQQAAYCSESWATFGMGLPPRASKALFAASFRREEPAVRAKHRLVKKRSRSESSGTFL